MDFDVLFGLTVPFIGTSLGAAGVYFMRKQLDEAVTKVLEGFAAGVMVAASVWSLIIPAIEQSTALGAWAFIPAFIGFWLGIFFLLILDRLIPKLKRNIRSTEGPKSSLKSMTMMALAVTLHNIPEGMAVGVAYAGLLSGSGGITAGGAFALALGIAIQNFPEGAIISMPLYTQGCTKSRSFLYGVLSGAVEPMFGFLTILGAAIVTPTMPVLLSFAAGAMMYVVAEELIPQMAQGKRAGFGVLAFSAGFTIMMALDVALG